MTTPAPPVDLFCDLMTHLLDEFDRLYAPECGLEGHDKQIWREFVRNAKRPYLCMTARRVLSGSWGFGTTQAEVGETLGLDRSRLSDALRKGEMTIDPFMAIRFAESRPDDLVPPPQLVDAMNRSGFIGVARYLATLVTDRPALIPVELDELNHEILCAIFRMYPKWMKGRFDRDTKMAAALLAEVCENGTEGVIPFWYQTDEAAAVKSKITQLQSNPARALEYIGKLQDAWEDVYVATAAVTETIRWR